MLMFATVAVLLLTPSVALASYSSEFNSIERSQCQAETSHQEEDDETSLLHILKQNIKHSHKVNKLKPIPPIGMVRVHKCASSTLKRIIMSLAITRNMSRMIPVDNGLGFPGPFPGIENRAMYAPPRHQFQIIVDHAVFNEENYSAYLAPGSMFLTVLREPVSQAISAYNYLKVAKSLMLKSHPFGGWESHLLWLSSLPPQVEHERDEAHFRNPQATVMGWYEYVGMTTEHDNDKSMIDQWLSTLDPNFNQIGGYALQDRFDESMVLLQRRLKVDIKELAYIYNNEGTENVQPTDRQREQLKQSLTVDIALYNHFNRTFAKFWHQDEEENKELLYTLQQANAEYEAFCSSETETIHPTGFCQLWVDGDVFKFGTDAVEKDKRWPWDEAAQEVYGCVPPSCQDVE
jgi:hypothetical protein